MSSPDVVTLAGAVLAHFGLPLFLKFLANRTKMEVSRLIIYPIKSCAGFEVSQAQFDRLGFLHDRRMVVVRRSDNRFVSQREYSRMALIGTKFKDENTLLITAPGMQPLEVSLELPVNPEYLTITVWKDALNSIAVSAESDAWFSQYLQVDARLVRVPPNQSQYSRPPDSKRTTPFAQQNNIEAPFSDGFPFLFLSEESVDALNARLPANQQVTVMNFRPNVVIRGCAPFEEDTWKSINIGGTTFDIVDACARCSIPTINQATGVRSADYQPTKAMREFRARGNQVYMGQNVMQRATSGLVKVGMPVTIEESLGHSNLDDVIISS